MTIARETIFAMGRLGWRRGEFTVLWGNDIRGDEYITGRRTLRGRMKAWLAIDRRFDRCWVVTHLPSGRRVGDFPCPTIAVAYAEALLLELPELAEAKQRLSDPGLRDRARMMLREYGGGMPR